MRTRQLLWQLIRYRPSLYMLDALVWVMIYIFQLVPGLIARQFFDAMGSSGTSQPALWLPFTLFFATSVLFILLMLGGTAVDSTLSLTVGSLLRKNLFAHLLTTFGLRSMLPASVEAINCFRDDVDEIENYLSWFIDIIGIVLFALLAMLLLIRINSTATMLIFLPLIFVITITKLTSKKVEAYREANRRATDQVTSFISEIFASVQAIKVANAEEHTVKYFASLNETRCKAALKDRLFNQLLESVFSNTFTLGIGIILLIAGQSIQARTFTVGDFTLFVYYLPWITQLAFFGGIFLTRYKQAGVSFRRMLTL
ncbi:MAG: ABC transporter transmembrane domain-containing protein, partial [Acidobacteriota bacterium]